MAVNLANPATGEMEMVGMDNAERGFIIANAEYVAASVDKTFFLATRAMRVKYIVARPTVAGTDVGAVTAVVRKVPDATAITSGTALHSGTFNLKGTANTNQVLALSTTSSDLDLAAGDALAIDFTGTLTSATGAIIVGLAPR